MYGGQLDVIPTNSFLSRLIIQTVRHPGLSYLVDELLTHQRGNDIYIRSFPTLAGKQFQDLRSLFSQAIPIGVVQHTGNRYVPHLNPPGTFTLSEDDRIALIAHRYQATEPTFDHFIEPEPLMDENPPSPAARHPRRILMLGWSHRTPALVEELSSYDDEQFEIDILSAVPPAERQNRLTSETDLPIDKLPKNQLEGEFTSDVVLGKVHPESYDNIIFLGSQRASSEEASDARAILGFTLLQSLLEGSDSRPRILVELMDPENANLFRHRPGEIIVSPRILSHVMAHVALRPELNVVFDELFTSSGAEIFFRPTEEYGAANKTVSFFQLEETAAACGEIALGVCLADTTNGTAGGVHLNPPQSRKWTLTADDQVIVLATY